MPIDYTLPDGGPSEARSTPGLPQPARRRFLGGLSEWVLFIVLGGALLALLIALIRPDGPPSPLALKVYPDDLGLMTSCANDVTARVVESEDSVRIDRISGDVMPGDDCLGSFTFPLSTPLGDRSVVVNGDEWVRVGSSCYAEVGTNRVHARRQCG